MKRRIASSACASFHQTALSRRHLLRVGGMGLLGLSLPNVPGVHVSERLPRVARIMDKVTLVRSMTHTMKNHNSAAYYALTGHAPPVDDIRLKDSPELFPMYGSVVDRLAPAS